MAQVSNSSPSPLNNAHHYISIKLTSTNYLFCKTQISPFLRGQDLFGYIDGSTVCPTPHIAEKDGEQRNDSNNYWTIHIKGCLGALAAAFSYPSNTRILNLHMQLQNLKQDYLSITQYHHKAKLLIDELAAAGRPICLPDQNIYMFKGLRCEFKDIITTLSARQEPVTFDELHSLLLSHEFIHGQALSSLSMSPSPMPDSAGNPSANFSQRSSQNERQYNHNNYRGHGCNNRGRRRPFCKRQGYRGGSSTENPWPSLDSRSRCQICNGVNHLAPNCFQRYNQTINSATSAYLSQQSPPITHQNWYPDSGATHHITPIFLSLHHVEDYKGMDQVHIGNGQGLPIHHTGNSLFSHPSKSLALNNILHVPSITKRLLSVQRFARNNDVFFEFHTSHFLVKDRASRTPLLSGRSDDGLYSLNLQPSYSKSSSKSPSTFLPAKMSSAYWHLRLGHPHK
ncbi:hypothetical protein KY285_001218 [Solanum tuberosum]|nr:hypothetical protein KY285_001218 [Solanum tuberosum]